MYGDASVLDRAQKLLPGYPEVRSALSDLRRLARDNHFEVSVDLADLRGYHYHSGVVFSAYVPGIAGAVALGGRYDEIGKAFGRSRAATGFSMDLRVLARACPGKSERGPVRAPWSDESDAALEAELSTLRAAGEVVIQALPGARDGERCERELVFNSGKWAVRPMKK
jgi:ATP phosphoribosyltransferase regulatory subunit